MEWPNYLQKLAITFDFPDFDVKEKFEWNKLSKDLKGLIFKYLKNLEEDCFYKLKDLRLVNKEFYYHFYKDKPRSCINYSVIYHSRFKDLTKILITSITSNQIKLFDYRENLFYNLINYYFILDNPRFDLDFIEDDYYYYDSETVTMIMDYLKSINIKLEGEYLKKFLRVLLKSDKIDWIENRFEPQSILNACVELKNCNLFYKICKKYDIKPNFNTLFKVLLDHFNKDILKLFDPDQYVELILKINLVYGSNHKEIINEIFNLITYVTDEQFKDLSKIFGNNKSFLNNEKLWPLFIKFEYELDPKQRMYFMTKNVFPFNFDYIVNYIYSSKSLMFYIAHVCDKDQLITLKNLIGSFAKNVNDEHEVYCIYYYIKNRFPDIYEEEFISGKFLTKGGGFKEDLLDFPFVDKKRIIAKVISLNLYFSSIKIVDDELYYLYDLNKNYHNYTDKRIIKQSIIHENIDMLYKIFQHHKNINKVGELIEFINSSLK